MTNNIIKTKLEGLFEISDLIFLDDRGFFKTLYKAKNKFYRKLWLNRTIKQINLSLTKDIGTIRGLHYQKEPYEDAKLIRCIAGKVWDVAIDLRPNSNSYCQWHSIELSPQKNNAIFIPEGFAHGYQVLESNSELLYLHSSDWVPESESGVRWNDKRINIKWPIAPNKISNRDKSLPYID